MSDTPESDKAWEDAWDEGGCYPEALLNLCRRLERQRDAYAETLRAILKNHDYLPSLSWFAEQIHKRHPELAQEGEKAQ